MIDVSKNNYKTFESKQQTENFRSFETFRRMQILLYIENNVSISKFTLPLIPTFHPKLWRRIYFPYIIILIYFLGEIFSLVEG